MSISPHKPAAVAVAASLTALAVPGAAYAQTSTPSSAPAVVRPMGSLSATLRLPDGKRTVHMWRTWYKNSNGKYHGHYGFTSASKGVSVYAVLWTSGKTRYLPTKGAHYSYKNESSVRMYACDDAYPNSDDCVYWN